MQHANSWLWHVGSSSLTRDQPRPLVWGVQSLSHWTNKEVPKFFFKNIFRGLTLNPDTQLNDKVAKVSKMECVCVCERERDRQTETERKQVCLKRASDRQRGPGMESGTFSHTLSQYSFWLDHRRR